MPNTPTSDVLERCPFCGSTDARVMRTGGTYRVMCWSCNAQTGCAETAAEVITAWDTRAEPTTIERLSAELEQRTELLERWLRLADSGHYRDGTELSIAAHPLADDTRAALTEKEGLASERT